MAHTFNLIALSSPGSLMSCEISHTLDRHAIEQKRSVTFLPTLVAHPVSYEGATHHHFQGLPVTETG